MPLYAIHDASGCILRTLDIPAESLEFNLNVGEFVFSGEAQPWDTIDATTGELLIGTKPEPSAPRERGARERAYPPLAEQLDMLWHAMNSGEIPKAEAFYSRILAVKLAIPLDGSEDGAAIVEAVAPIPSGEGP